MTRQGNWLKWLNALRVIGDAQLQGVLPVPSELAWLACRKRHVCTGPTISLFGIVCELFVPVSQCSNVDCPTAVNGGDDSAQCQCLRAVCRPPVEQWRLLLKIMIVGREHHQIRKQLQKKLPMQDFKPAWWDPAFTLLYVTEPHECRCGNTWYI